jgi:transglutaminase-like putative cysteine protease
MNPKARAAESRWRVSHTTRYRYAEPVSLSFHQALLTPRQTPLQTVRFTTITMDPAARSSSSREDYYGNCITTFTVGSSHEALTVHAESIVVMEPQAFEPVSCQSKLTEVRQQIRSGENGPVRSALEFCFDSPRVTRSEALAAYGDVSFPAGRSFLDGVGDLMHRIKREFRYDPKVTTVSTPVAEVLDAKHGVCQDFAHLMIGCLRSLGVAARYVSGYLVPGRGVVGAQASHAWLSVYSLEAGWVDFDPTNDVIPSNGHITVAWGRDYSDVSPFRGVMIGGGEHTVGVDVQVESVPDIPISCES